MNKKILFVYNADSDTFSQIKDLVTKVVAPKKYQCNLCAVTYGPIKIKNEWKTFLDNLPQEKVFMHRDEFRTIYPDKADVPLPVILSEENNTLNIIISADEINQQKTLSDLERLVKGRLK